MMVPSRTRCANCAEDCKQPDPNEEGDAFATFDEAPDAEAPDSGDSPTSSELHDICAQWRGRHCDSHCSGDSSNKKNVPWRKQRRENMEQIGKENLHILCVVVSFWLALVLHGKM